MVLKDKRERKVVWEQLVSVEYPERMVAKVKKEQLEIQEKLEAKE